MSASHPAFPRPLAAFDLSGRRALVTGSTQGLGLALARGLAQAGAAVLINGRTAARVGHTVQTLRDEGLSAHPLPMDVSDEADVVRQVTAAQADGPIDILVNNVGIHDRAPLADMTTDQWRRVIDVNLTTAFVVSREVVGAMIDRRAGKIVNICSLMSELGRPTTGNYAAAKGGLKMLTRAMTTEWAQHNVQVNGIGPGYFATQLTQALVDDAEFNAWICGRTPAGRWGKPEELVGAAVFLASPASSFVNGQILYVDGGLTAAV